MKVISFKAFSDNQISDLTIENTKAEIKTGAFVNNKMSGDEAFIYKRTKKGKKHNHEKEDFLFSSCALFDFFAFNGFYRLH